MGAANARAQGPGKVTHESVPKRPHLPLKCCFRGHEFAQSHSKTLGAPDPRVGSLPVKMVGRPGGGGDAGRDRQVPWPKAVGSISRALILIFFLLSVASRY